MGAMAGPGAVGHIDILCQCSWALQIQGTKRWWLRSPLIESLEDATDRRVGGAGQTFEFLQKPGEMFFFCPGWWHSTYVEDPADNDTPTAAAPESSGSGWKKLQKKKVESLSLHAYVDLRPVGWAGDSAGTAALEQTDLLRTSMGGQLARTARGTEYAWTLANSSSANMRDPTMLNQLVRRPTMQRSTIAASRLRRAGGTCMSYPCSLLAIDLLVRSGVGCLVPICAGTVPCICDDARVLGNACRSYHYRCVAAQSFQRRLHANSFLFFNKCHHM